ncbi:MAG: hypothetical protein AAB955_01325 [Patescibacteria group bacterium]
MAENAPRKESVGDSLWWATKCAAIPALSLIWLPYFVGADRKLDGLVTQLTGLTSGESVTSVVEKPTAWIRKDTTYSYDGMEEFYSSWEVFMTSMVISIALVSLAFKLLKKN